MLTRVGILRSPHLDEGPRIFLECCFDPVLHSTPAASTPILPWTSASKARWSEIYWTWQALFCPTWRISSPVPAAPAAPAALAQGLPLSFPRLGWQHEQPIVIWEGNVFGNLSPAWSLWLKLPLLSIHTPLPHQYTESKSDYFTSIQKSPRGLKIKSNLLTRTLEAPATFPGCLFLFCLILVPWQILKDWDSKDAPHPDCLSIKA